MFWIIYLNSLFQCSVLCANIRGLHRNLTDLVGVATECDVLVLSETLVSTRRHSAELLVPGFEKPYLKFSEVNLVNGSPATRGMAAYVRSGYHATRIKNLECSCHEMLVVRVSGRLSNYYIFSIYRSPNADDSILDCLMAKLEAVQQSDSRASFVFTGDFNAHNEV